MFVANLLTRAGADLADAVHGVGGWSYLWCLGMKMAYLTLSQVSIQTVGSSSATRLADSFTCYGWSVGGVAGAGQRVGGGVRAPGAWESGGGLTSWNRISTAGAWPGSWVPVACAWRGD